MTLAYCIFYELISKAMRVPHWHSNANEMGIVLSGKKRVTLYEGNGKSIVYTVKPNATWVIPKGKLHSLENIGAEKLRFIVSYDSPIAGERDFITAWSSLPHAILASCLGLPEKDIENIQKSTNNPLSQFEPSLKPIFHIVNSDLSLDLDSKKPLFENEWGALHVLITDSMNIWVTMPSKKPLLKLVDCAFHIGIPQAMYCYL